MRSKPGVQKLALIVAALIRISTYVTAADVDEDTLELLQVVVRHGNRSSNSIFTQFVPQYIEWINPFEFGQLTTNGRRQMVNSGQFLRQRYADFLPEDFSYASISVKCAGSARIMESAMIGMAAMFPPADRQKWQDSGLGAIWTPIPCQSVPEDEDKVLSPGTINCPRMTQMMNAVGDSPQYLARFNELTGNGSVIEYIQRSLNMSTSEPLSRDNLGNVRENLSLMESMEVPLPEWSHLVYPYPLIDIDHLGFWELYATPELLTFSVGEYLREMLRIADDVQNRQMRPKSRKMFISFTHDLTFMPLLVALNLETNPPQPDYGALFIIELHRIRETDEIGLKFVYRNVTWKEPIIYTIPGCQQICPLSFVKETVEQYIPTPSFEELCPLDQD